VRSCIEGEFSGWAIGTVFVLCNGQVWLQTSGTYTYHYAYRPQVTVLFGAGGYELSVTGMTTTVLVRPANVVANTCISGSFEGWSGNTLFPLCDGEVWQQSSYTYIYHYAYRPNVLIYVGLYGGYVMKVDGVSETVSVVRVR
jgi:hypothetical protein